MTQENEKLVGFDLRVTPDEDDAAWTPSRRAQYLLRPDVNRPLSTDVWVWGSVLHPDHARALTFDTDLLAERLRAAPAPAPWIVAFTRIVEPGHAEMAAMGGEILTEPLPDDWTFLGYDVSDRSLLSGYPTAATSLTRSTPCGGASRPI